MTGPDPADRPAALRYLKAWAAELQTRPAVELRQIRGLTSSLVVVIMTLEESDQ